MSRFLAYGIVLSVYLMFFGDAIYNAVLLWASPGIQGTLQSLTWPIAASQALDELLQSFTAVAVVYLVLKWRRLPTSSIGVFPLWARQRPTRWRVAGLVGLIAFGALFGGAMIDGLLTSRTFPFLKPSGPDLLNGLVSAFNAGIVEETVVLGLLVVLLRQTKAGRVEIVLVVTVLRCLYHLYYGPGVVGVVVWAAVFAVLFLSFRRLTPLIVAHWLWDSIGNLVQQHEGLSVGLILLASFLTLCVTLIWKPRDRGRELLLPDT
ncbi:MAG: CPBP family glutamic-type intramembrane protease [Acidimicrobiales bacterium]